MVSHGCKALVCSRKLIPLACTENLMVRHQRVRAHDSPKPSGFNTQRRDCALINRHSLDLPNPETSEFRPDARLKIAVNSFRWMWWSKKVTFLCVIEVSFASYTIISASTNWSSLKFHPHAWFGPPSNIPVISLMHRDHSQSMPIDILRFKIL